MNIRTFPEHSTFRVGTIPRQQTHRPMNDLSLPVFGGRGRGGGVGWGGENQSKQLTIRGTDTVEYVDNNATM